MKKKTYVVYEVWTKARTVKATSRSEALQKATPKGGPKGFNLSNWHAERAR